MTPPKLSVPSRSVEIGGPPARLNGPFNRCPVAEPSAVAGPMVAAGTAVAVEPVVAAETAVEPVVAVVPVDGAASEGSR